MDQKICALSNGTREKIKRLIEEEFNEKTNGILIAVNVEHGGSVHWIETCLVDETYLAGIVEEDWRRKARNSGLPSNIFWCFWQSMKAMKELSEKIEFLESVHNNKKVH